MSANNFELHTTYSVGDTLAKYRMEMEALENGGNGVVGTRSAESILAAEEARMVERRRKMRELAEADARAERKTAEGGNDAQSQKEETFSVTNTAKEERQKDDEMAKLRSDAASHIRTDEAYIAYSLEIRRELENQSKALLKAQRDKELRAVLGQCERDEAERRRRIESGWFAICFFVSEAVRDYYAYVRDNVFEKTQIKINAAVTSDEYNTLRFKLKRYLERPMSIDSASSTVDPGTSPDLEAKADAHDENNSNLPLSISEAFLLCNIDAELRCRDRITATAEARRAAEWEASAATHMSALDSLLATEAQSIKNERQRIAQQGIIDDSTLGPIDRNPFNRFDFYRGEQYQVNKRRSVADGRCPRDPPHPLSSYITHDEKIKEDTLAARAALNADKWRAKVFDDEVTRAVYYASALEFRSTDKMAKYLQ